MHRAHRLVHGEHHAPNLEQQMIDSQTQPAERLAIPLTEGVRMMGIGLSYAYELMKSGQLKTFKIGRRRLVTRQSLQDFIDAQQAQAGRKKAA